MFERDESRAHGFGLSGTGQALLIGAAVITAPIWGPVWLVKKGIKKIKDKVKK